MADFSELYGACACERNQYMVVIPAASTSQAQVFFDNSIANRRSQAAPVTAWLRVPLEWYHSCTFAQFPDESHGSIKRTFNTRSSNPVLPPTRRQFCGYCGTHLTAWNEGLGGLDRSADYLDVTLGSLLQESLNKLQELRMYGDWDEESDSGLVKSPLAQIDNDPHVPTNETAVGGVDRPPEAQQIPVVSHRMHGRGLPYFEEMVENSRLGRIKRQRGGHTSADGTTSVQWEIMELGGEDEFMADTGNVSPVSGNENKRMRMDA